MALAQSGSPTPWRVVILNGSDPNLPAFLAIDRAMRAALTAPSAHPVEIYSETLDAMRFPGKELEPEILALLSRKYADRSVDAVVTVAPSALEFAEKHHDLLWPSARIVYHSVPDEVLAKMHLRPETTGVPIRHALASTVDLALLLRPHTNRVVVISGSGDFDVLMSSLAKAGLERFKSRVQIEYWLDRTVDDLVAQVSRLPSDSIVLYLTVYRDAAGRMFAPRDALKRLAEASSVPIFGAVETYVGWGIAAGQVDSLELRGQRAAQLVHAGLSHPSSSQTTSTGTTRCVADANQLARLGLDEDRLPQECEVLFRQPSLWHDYRWPVIGVALALIAQSALVVALLVQRRYRRIAELEAQRRRAEAMHTSRLALVGELSASIAHEINQPLGAILTNADAAEMLLDANPARLDDVRRILADIRRDDLRASDVIRQIRSLARKRNPEYVPIACDALLQEVADIIHVEALRRGVDVRVRAGAPKAMVLGDRVHLQQVLLALTINAKEAMADVDPSRRTLTLSTIPTNDGRVSFEVSDMGRGIDPAVASTMFDSFVTTKREGVGLGLSIARTIVEAHEGTIEARNGAGGGAVFTVTLPCAPAGAAHGQLKAQQA